MKIKASPTNNPTPIGPYFCAVDDDTYDGPGSPIGLGDTEAEAIADLLEQIAESTAAELPRGRG